MKVSERAQKVSRAQTSLAMALNNFQADHGLTTIEMFQGLASWQQTSLKYMLRRERNPEHPDREADVDYDDKDTP